MNQRFRQSLLISLSIGLLLFSFNNCSDVALKQDLTQVSQSNSTPPPGGSPDAPVWKLDPQLVFTQGSGMTMNLASTLPVGIKAGGTFEVDPAGARLPVGMTLAANGLLSLNNAVVSEAAGVIFNYTEPQ